MAKKNSPGCGIVIMGLIALAIAAKYWYVLVAVGFIALAIWGVVKLTRSCSTPDAFDENLELQDVMVSTAVTDTPAKQSTKTSCAFCNTTGLHRILRITEKTIDCHCIACGKNFFIFKSDGNIVVDTPAPIIISDPKANTLINHQPPQNNSELLEKALGRNNRNDDQLNAVIEKDLAKEKAAAEVAMKIINRLGVALVDTEIQRILSAKKAALQERDAQVNAEIEKDLAAKKVVASAAVAEENATVVGVTAKEKVA